MNEVRFTVYGEPAPQGSKTRNRWGGVREDNPRTQPWRQEIAGKAIEAMGGRPPLTGPVEFRAEFTFPRLVSHYGTGRNAGRVKDNAPVWKPTAPDLDKVIRACCDALAGIAFLNDAQVVALTATKTYGTRAYADITVRPAPFTEEDEA